MAPPLLLEGACEVGESVMTAAVIDNSCRLAVSAGSEVCVNSPHGLFGHAKFHEFRFVFFRRSFYICSQDWASSLGWTNDESSARLPTTMHCRDVSVRRFMPKQFGLVAKEVTTNCCAIRAVQTAHCPRAEVLRAVVKEGGEGGGGVALPHAINTSRIQVQTPRINPTLAIRHIELGPFVEH